MPKSGATAALIAAMLFGLGTPLAKLLLSDVSPWLLAGLLYLGSGLGLAVVMVVGRVLGPAEQKQAMLASGERIWLAAAIACGGVVAPVVLLMGLRLVPAATGSLLLNLESVLTALMAWFIFREGFDRRIALGMAAILAGAALLGWQDEMSFAGLAGPLLIAAACLGWAADNNLTRKISGADPVMVAMVKGLAAGLTNCVLALGFGAGWPDAVTVGEVGLLGFFGYGVSLVLFVVALSRIGAARTGAYFAVAPFVGGLFAVIALGEAVTPQLVGAGLLMALGVALHLTEAHEHPHDHPVMSHDHVHRHDDHHRHQHDGDVSEPHAHRHDHGPLWHKHPHFPDLHHLHSHRQAAASVDDDHRH